MSYKSSEKLQRLIVLALTDSEIQKGKSETGISDKELAAIVLADEEKIWNVALEQIQSFDNLQNYVNQKKSAIEKLRHNKSEEDKILVQKSEEEITEGELRLSNLQGNIDKAIIEQSIKEILRKQINQALTSSYSTIFQIISAPGLSEVIDLSRTIDTKAKKSLQFLLENMPGGSIGIAGPRGAGKSTLITAYCGPERKIQEVKDKKIFPVFTSAPVQYDPRDFILHLFSTACRSVLKQEGVREDVFELTEIGDRQEMFLPQRYITGYIYPILKALSPLCLLFGTIFISIGILLIIFYPKKSFSPTPTVQVINIPNQISGDSLAHLSNILNKEKPEPVNLIKILKLEPEPFFRWGFIMLLILVAYLFVYRIRKNLSRSDTH
jgi:GTPase SAR1 family protein